MHRLPSGQGSLRSCRIKPWTEDWWLQWSGGGGKGGAGPGSPHGTRERSRGCEASSLNFSVTQVPALVAKTVPTINAINYALGGEMVHRGIWQCLSPQGSGLDRAR